MSNLEDVLNEGANSKQFGSMTEEVKNGTCVLYQCHCDEVFSPLLVCVVDTRCGHTHEGFCSWDKNHPDFSETVIGFRI